MVEGARRLGKAAPQRLCHLFDSAFFLVEGAQHDALETADVDEVVGQGAGAVGIEAFTAIAFAQRILSDLPISDPESCAAGALTA